MKIADLVNPNYKVYVYLRTKEVQEQFFRDAGEEGFHFGDGVDLLLKPLENLIAIYPDKRLAYTGVIGHMAFRHPEDNIPPLIRVDYEKFISVADDYILKETPASFGEAGFLSGSFPEAQF